MSLSRRKFLRALGAGTAGLSVAAARPARAFPNPPVTLSAENPRDPERLAPGADRRVLIVGGGLAGLSAALELSDRGYRVTLKEARSVLGGRLATRPVETPEGTFQVEHGLHMWFDNYHVFRDIRARLGIDRWFRPYNQIHFTFRHYQDEVLESTPPIYPLNLLGIIRRSPNLNLLDAVKQLRMLPDVMFFNYHGLYERLDGLSFPEWARKRGISSKFYDVLLVPAASVTLNDVSRISAAEMVLFMHYFFIGQPRAMNRDITTVDHHTAVLGPWAARLGAQGVEIRLGSPVQGLRFLGDRVVGEIDSAERFDSVVLATEVPGAQRILSRSRASDARAEALLSSLWGQLQGLGVAPPYKVLRVWFDRRPHPSRPDVLETPEHPPINLLAQFHLLEQEAGRWADRTGGSVLEFHLYAQPFWSQVSDEDVWGIIRPVALELLPEMKDARVLAYHVNSHHDFTSVEVGQGSIRPASDTPRQMGFANLALAGDWVSTGYPSALMERAVATGREAANLILKDDQVRQAPLTVTSSHGPGLL